MKWRFGLVIASLIFLVACSGDEKLKSVDGKVKNETLVEHDKLEQHPLRMLGDDQLQQTMEMLSYFDSKIDDNFDFSLRDIHQERPFEFYERFQDGDGAYLFSYVETYTSAKDDITYTKITNDEIKNMNTSYAELFSKQAKTLQKLTKEYDPEQKVKFFQTLIEKYKQLETGYKQLNDVVGKEEFAEDYEKIMLLYADIELLMALLAQAVEISSELENFFDEYNDLISTDKYESLTEQDKKYLAGGLMACMILAESDVRYWVPLYTLYDISKTHYQSINEDLFYGKIDEYRNYLAEQESYAPFTPFVGYMGTSFRSLGVTDIEEPEKAFMILKQYVNESPVEFPRLQLGVELWQQVISEEYEVTTNAQVETFDLTNDEINQYMDDNSNFMYLLFDLMMEEDMNKGLDLKDESTVYNSDTGDYLAYRIIVNGVPIEYYFDNFGTLIFVSEYESTANSDKNNYTFINDRLAHMSKHGKVVYINDDPVLLAKEQQRIESYMEK